MKAFKYTLIKGLYRYGLRPILFCFDPTYIHGSFIRTGHRLGRFKLTRKITRYFFSYKNKNLEQNILGIHFDNPVGLAAGFDKNVNLINIIQEVGFGFSEVGTLTNQPSIGNQPPLLTRLPKSKAILVNYGLKNIGLDKALEKLKARIKNNLPLGISIGQTNNRIANTTQEAIEDIYQGFKKMLNTEQGAYYVLNISCPNINDQERFSQPVLLEQLLKKIFTLQITKPIFIKMPINLGWSDFRKILDVAVGHNVKGVIIGNLNKNRQDPSIKDIVPERPGSISGKPTEQLSNQLIAKTYQEFSNKLIIIGVGGIFSAEDAYKKIKLGASLVQLITGMIYEGPQLIAEINLGLAENLKREGYKSIQEAIGKS